MSEIGRDPKRIAAIAMFSFLIATAGFFNTFDLSSGRISGITKTTANSLYCSKDSTTICPPACNTPNVAIIVPSDNCSGMYCGNINAFNLGIPADACTSSYLLRIDMFSDNSTRRTFSSSTFTTYTKALASGGLPAAVDGSVHQVSCIANAQIQSSNLLAVVDFKIRETTNGRDGTVWRDNTLAANDNFTISYATYPSVSGSTMFASSNSVFALQFSVTGTGSITVYHATIDCFVNDQIASSAVA